MEIFDPSMPIYRIPVSFYIVVALLVSLVCLYLATRATRYLPVHVISFLVVPMLLTTIGLIPIVVFLLFLLGAGMCLRPWELFHKEESGRYL